MRVLSPAKDTVRCRKPKRITARCMISLGTDPCRLVPPMTVVYMCCHCNRTTARHLTAQPSGQANHIASCSIVSTSGKPRPDLVSERVDRISRRSDGSQCVPEPDLTGSGRCVAAGKSGPKPMQLSAGGVHHAGFNQIQLGMRSGCCLPNGVVYASGGDRCLLMIV